MKYALIDGQKTEPRPKLKGFCPHCGNPTIAKCGDIKVWHWAHKGKRSCDPWWENETEWHRAWKNNFSEGWQEQSFIDNHTNEKHIADVCTEKGLIVEFQHSFLKPDERQARENFYKKMVWVVDGTRRVRDYPRFNNEKEFFGQTHKAGLYIVSSPEECFPKDWIDSTKPVIFDFKKNYEVEEGEETLWCLPPYNKKGPAVVIALDRKNFVELATNDGLFSVLSQAIQEATKYHASIQAQRQAQLRSFRARSQQPVIRRRKSGRRYRRY